MDEGVAWAPPAARPPACVPPPGPGHQDRAPPGQPTGRSGNRDREVGEGRDGTGENGIRCEEMRLASDGRAGQWVCRAGRHVGSLVTALWDSVPTGCVGAWTPGTPGFESLLVCELQETHLCLRHVMIAPTP